MDNNSRIDDKKERDSIRAESPENKMVVDYVESRTEAHRIRLISSSIAAGVVGIALFACHDSINDETKLVVAGVALTLGALATGMAARFEKLSGQMNILSEKKELQVLHALEQLETASPSLRPVIKQTERRFCPHSTLRIQSSDVEDEELE